MNNMELEKYLVLNKYFLNFFGFNEFSELREKIKDTGEDYYSDERSYFFNTLIGLKGLKSDFKDKLQKYDGAIKEYVDRLSDNRGEAIRLKYFQYLAILFAEMFLERYYTDRSQLLNDLNGFLNDYIEKNKVQFNEKNDQFTFTENDIKKLAFWMATGSGKTLIMHINYWQILKYSKKYSKKDWDNIILITPNEGLSEQHRKELELSGIPCRAYDGNIDNLKTKDGEILIIDIYKLTEKKEGRGASVDVSYFGNNNLVFVDEGHKGQKTDEQTWKKLREALGKKGFIFEYSATFGQVIENNEDLLKEYAKAIIMDYSYKYFYDDGYGKDFYVYNIRKDSNSDSTEEQERLLLTAGLLSFYEQLHAFEENKEKLREYQIEKPLWVFVGSKVSGKGINSDIVKVIMFLDKILKDENYLKDNIIRILEGRSGFVESDGIDIFKDKFKFLKDMKKDINIDALVNDIYNKIFGGRGTLEIKEIKTVEGEIGLRTSSGEYFGVVNVGNITDLKNLLKSKELKLNIKEDDNFQKISLFESIDKTPSINILIGSKKFLEGWNSYRVSTMCLLNMGKNEGAQIIQLFGRGIRLKGKNSSLKREENPDGYLKVLQTLSIIGLNANYMGTFIKSLQREGVDYENIEIKIKFNQSNKWNGKIYTIKTRDGFNFLNFPIALNEDEDVLKKIEIHLVPKITITRELKVENVVSEIKEPIKIPKDYFDLIDWNEIYREIINYKVNNGMYNIHIDLAVIREIIKSKEYKIFMIPSEGLDIDISSNNIKITSFRGIELLKKIVLDVAKNYIDEFYYKKEREKSMEFLVAEQLTDKSSSMLPYDNQITLKVQKDFKYMSDIISEVEKIKKSNFGQLNEDYFIHFENHLYTPLVISNIEEIKSTPVALNEGEIKFIKDFRDFLKKNKDLFKEMDVFILRNLPRSGIGFFFKQGFYPDFIIWINNKDKQHIIFVDPKGLEYIKNISKDPKVQLYKNIKEIEKRLNEIWNKNNFKFQLDAFIVSVTPFTDVKDRFNVDGGNKENFEDLHIFFEEDSDYIYKMFKKIEIIS